MSKPKLLFHAGGECLTRYGTLVRRTRLEEDVAEVFTRSGTVGTAVDRNGVLIGHAANVPRVSWPLVDGVRTPALLLEGARTNLALHSTDISNAAWDVSGAVKSAATSLVSGGTAQEVASTGSGAEALRQTIGTLTGTPETLSFLIENVDAVVTRFGIYDSTATAFVSNANFTWATGALSTPTGTAGSDRSARARYWGVGPNGGDTYLVEITGTPTNSGNNRQVWLYPGGQLGNTQAVIVHYGQHEAGNSYASSLIVTGAASAPRNAETFYSPFTHAPQAMTVYARFVEGTAHGASASGSLRVLQIGNAANNAPRLILFRRNSTAGYEMHYEGGGGLTTVQSNTGGTVNVGDDVELLGLHNADGSVTLTCATNGTVTSTGTTSAARAFVAAWSGPRLYINSVGSSAPGLAAYRSVKVAAGTKTLAEMRDA